jgi:hypothetical protein
MDGLCGKEIQTLCTGDYLLSPRRTIIGTTALNFSVRNGERCIHRVEPPEQSV